MILKNGFYISEGTLWVDWHAGHKFEGISYECLILRNDGNYIKTSKNDENLLNDMSINFGKYNTVKNILELTYEVWGEEREILFTILSPEILLDKELKEYHFKYAVGIEFKEEWLLKAINRGDDIWAASNPMELNLLFKSLYKVPVDKIRTPDDLAEFLIDLVDPEILKNITGFGNEIKLLSEKGYLYNQTTKIFIKSLPNR